MDNKMLVKNNAFITAKYNLTLDENRLFVYILYNIQKNKNGLSCTINRDDFSNIFKNRTNSTVNGVTKVLDDIKKKSIYFKENLEDGSTNWGSYVFLMGYVYNNKSDSFKIEVPERVYNLLMQYIDGYTPITLQTWLGLKNTYAQRFYDLLRMWSGTKNIINYKVEDLKMYFQIDDKYPNFKDFKRRVILPAIKELNETGYFEIDIKENKVGRKVDSIDFIVKDLDKRKYFTKDDTTKEIPSEVIEEVAVMLDNTIIDGEEKTVFKPNFNTLNDNINESKECDFEPFVPDETLFTKGTLRSFKRDFNTIDFKNKYMLNAFDDAVMIVLDRDDVETIKATSYKFFKGTLDNKIIEYQKEEIEDIAHKKELDMYW
ncbi:replication initiation protein [Romboutsia sp.]|uniref:replication initiation protein n=1 Tax=Romboutsia sp. TaxID=1965302 RepID=UPI003F3A8DB7